MLEKRIYIISVGFKTEWILDSIRSIRPDIVYILEDSKENNKDYFKAKKEIMKELFKKETSYSDIKYTRESEYDILKLLKPIIENHFKDKIYLNLSSGDRKVPSMFIMASFLFRSINNKIYLVSYNSSSNEIVEFPSFTVKLPDSKLIEVLKEIDKLGDFCSKKKLCDILLNKNILKVNTDTSANRLMCLNRNFLQKLINWNFIEIEGKNKNATIKITLEGRKWLMFM